MIARQSLGASCLVAICLGSNLIGCGDPQQTEQGGFSGSAGASGSGTGGASAAGGTAGASAGGTGAFGGTGGDVATGGVGAQGGAGAVGGTGGAGAEGGVGGSAPACAGKPGLPGLTPRTLTIAGAPRTYLLYVPPTLAPDAAVPVVFAHHGFTMSGEIMRTLTGFEALADEKGFVVGFPDGAGTTWTTGPGACGVGGLNSSTADDFAFVEGMLADIESVQCIDRTRTFTTGFSMGGYFSNHIACERPDLVRAIAPHSGGRELETSCLPGPKPVMVLHGTTDALITYSCGEDARNAWVAHNGCSTDVDVVPIKGGSCEYSKGCPPNGPVALCKLDGMGHGWAGHVGGIYGGGTQFEDATRLAWDFFAAQ